MTDQHFLISEILEELSSVYHVDGMTNFKKLLLSKNLLDEQMFQMTLLELVDNRYENPKGWMWILSEKGKIELEKEKRIRGKKAILEEKQNKKIEYDYLSSKYWKIPIVVSILALIFSVIIPLYLNRDKNEKLTQMQSKLLDLEGKLIETNRKTLQVVDSLYQKDHTLKQSKKKLK